MGFWKDLLLRGLSDDGWEWDWTTRSSVGRADRSVRARVIAKSDGIWSAAPLVAEAEALSKELGLGRGLAIRSKLKDGARLRKGLVVCDWSGPARLVLALERPFLNLASYAGGIATQTSRMVEALETAWASNRCKGPAPWVTFTRKTLPGYRDLAVHSVISGGGHPHRLGLSGGVLIKENHIAASGGISKAISGARAHAPHLLKIEIEVRNVKELSQALAGRADVIMLDNFTPAQAREALRVTAEAKYPVLVEVSGGIGEANIAEYAIPGIHIISCGSLTHSVRSIDLSLLVQ